MTMTCPKCEGKSTVINTAVDVDEVVRLRRCLSCNYRFYTAERDIDPSYGYDVINRIRGRLRYKNKKRGFSNEN